MTTKATIYKLDNGFFLSLVSGQKLKQLVFTFEELGLDRTRIYAEIDRWLDWLETSPPKKEDD